MLSVIWPRVISGGHKICKTPQNEPVRGLPGQHICPDYKNKAESKRLRLSQSFSRPECSCEYLLLCVDKYRKPCFS